MKKCLPVGLLLFLGAGLVLTAQEPSTGSPQVVVVSMDGAADWLVDDLLARGVLPPDGAFARMSRHGARAEAMLPVNVSSTAPAHVAMFTGAYPERNGIVANSFLLPGSPLSRSTSGFDAPIEAETLWQAARRQGKRVICVAAVGASGRTPEKDCDLTFGYGQAAGRSALARLRPSAGTTWKLGGRKFEHQRNLEAVPETPGPVRYQLWNREPAPVHVLAVDRTLDGIERFDALYVDFDRDLGNGYAALLRPGEWSALWLPIESERIGGWVQLQELAPDLSSITLYLGSPGFNRGYPATFLQGLESRLGPWPGQQDGGSLRRGLIDETVWWQQVERLNNYLRDVALDAMKRNEWDLFVTYFPIINEVGHEFLLRDPRQEGYEAENGEKRIRYARYIERSYQIADATLLQWMEAVPEANFIVVSDHGMLPVRHAVVLMSLLKQAGFRVTDDDTSEVRAYGSGPNAHIYLNLAGRQPGGVVPPEKMEAYVDRIVEACRELRDPVTDEPVFEVVLRKAELGKIQLGHPERAGDVFVNAVPGWTVLHRVDLSLPVVIPAGNKLGDHGYLGGHRQVQAVFYAAGPNVPRTKPGLVRRVDVAPTAAALLGIEPPKDNQGRAVLNPVR